MKNFLLVVLALFPIVGFAQKVDKKGNIECHGEKIGRVEKSGGIVKSYSLYDAKGEEIVSFEPNGKPAPDFRYNVTFIRTENKGECPGNLSFHKKIATAFAKSELVKNGTYQYRRESRFMSLISGGVYLGGNVDINPNKKEEEEILLDRDRDADIQVFGNTVKQDFKKIASVEKTQKATGGTIVVRIKIFDYKNIQIAEASTEGVTSTKYKVVTLKDNETHNVNAESTLYIVRDIIAALVKDYYL